MEPDERASICENRTSAKLLHLYSSLSVISLTMGRPNRAYEIQAFANTVKHFNALVWFYGVVAADKTFEAVAAKRESDNPVFCGRSFSVYSSLL